jgi:polysaccharide biosynthesis protein PslH
VAKLLTICPYRLLPLRGGGALRCYHLLRQLARVHEVHAIIFQPESELRGASEGNGLPDSVRIYSPIDTPAPPSLFNLLPGRLANALHYRWLRRNLRGPATAELLAAHHLIRDILAANPIDAVIFETLGTMTAVPLARRVRPGLKFILDAHNVESRLLDRQMKNDSAPSSRRNAGLARLRRIESRLDQDVDAIWACSNEDSREFQAFNKVPVITVPNGVDTHSKPFDCNPAKRQRRELLFCGSLSYPPNWQGLRWFLREAWPVVRNLDPGACLKIVGSGKIPTALEEVVIGPNITLVGEVLDLAPVYGGASVAICPLLTGSGTRLKILEAMSFGVPVVSTRIGAEGIDALDGRDFLLADKSDDFASSIRRLLSEPALYEMIQQSARRLVEQRYEWDIIGQLALAALDSTFAQSGIQQPPEAKLASDEDK